MKKIISIALIALMSAQSIYQLGVITYFQLNRDFIAEFLCINKEEPITICNGQCFLENNLELANDSDALPTSAAKERVDFPTFVVSTILKITSPPGAHTQGQTMYLSGSSSLHREVPFHPPSIA